MELLHSWLIDLTSLWWKMPCHVMSYFQTCQTERKMLLRNRSACCYYPAFSNLVSEKIVKSVFYFLCNESRKSLLFAGLLQSSVNLAMAFAVLYTHKTSLRGAEGISSCAISAIQCSFLQIQMSEWAKFTSVWIIVSARPEISLYHSVFRSPWSFHFQYWSWSWSLLVFSVKLLNSR